MAHSHREPAAPHRKSFHAGVTILHIHALAHQKGSMFPSHCENISKGSRILTGGARRRRAGSRDPTIRQGRPGSHGVEPVGRISAGAWVHSAPNRRPWSPAAEGRGVRTNEAGARHGHLDFRKGDSYCRPGLPARLTRLYPHHPRKVHRRTQGSYRTQGHSGY